MQLQVIYNKIYDIRGEKVMLDFDLAELFETETKFINLAVKRNLRKFPVDFMFQLTENEWQNLRLQFATSSWGGKRYMPYAFTEHGVTMVATILRSEIATNMSIAIVRAFIGLRKLAIKNNELIELIKSLKERVEGHDTQLNQIYETLENMLDEQADKKANDLEWKNRERIGFKK